MHHIAGLYVCGAYLALALLLTSRARQSTHLSQDQRECEQYVLCPLPPDTYSAAFIGITETLPITKHYNPHVRICKHVFLS